MKEADDMSRTKENLKAAIEGESMARTKYSYFAEVAREEGYHYIAKLFEETAENEKQHAIDNYRLLMEEGDTASNLREAIAGENYETTEMYPEFARIAEEEGDKRAAALFRMISRVEERHRNRYRKLLEMVEKGTVYRRTEPIRWKCSVCGYIHEGTEPPPKCPSCKHPREYYEPECLSF